MGFTIKNKDAIRDYGYIELGIYFGRRITAEEIFAFVEEIRDKVEAQAGIDYCVSLKNIELTHPDDLQ
jgi:hypothetical protein